METGHQLLSQDKRDKKSKEVNIQFTFLADDFTYYNVIKTEPMFQEKFTAYIGRITKVPTESEYCSCQDHLHRNSESYKNEHGYSLQCKHMIQAKKKRGWSI